MPWYFIFAGFVFLLSAMLYLRLSHRVKPAGAGIFFLLHDDSDMKIVGQTPAPNPEVSDAQHYVQAKEDGSIDKAEKLGEALSYMVNEIDFSSLQNVDTENPDVLVHLFLLCVFSIDHTLDQCFSSPLLSQVAQNKFIQQLDTKTTYNDIHVNGAYSMYKLAARSRNVENEIGQAFAELCLKEKDPSYAQAGTDLYLQLSQGTRELFASMDFPNEN